MAESQLVHRQALEKQVVDSNCKAQARGPIYGFIICMTAVIGGIYLIQAGQSTEGIASIIAALAALAGVFIYGKRKQQQQLQQKAEALADRAS